MLLWKLETRLQSFLIVVKRNVFGIAVNTVTHKIIIIIIIIIIIKGGDK